jgi:1-deoxy-D-xylulose-5-phosphate reductoisomerase
MKNYISILGSTGSIGLTVFKIIKKKRSFFVVNILAANKNYQLICKQIEKFKPKIFLINDYQTFLKVKKNIETKI